MAVERASVSVVLPVRDGGSWLAGALVSVLDNATVAQVVVVDDGSADGAVPAAVAFAADARVKVVSLPATGLAGALNVGLEAARFPLLARMDADDISLPGRIDRQVANWHALNDDRAVLGCRVRPIAGQDGDEAPGPGFARFCRWQNGLLTPADHRRERFIETPLTHPTMLALTNLVREHGGWRDGPFPEDYDLFLRLLGAGVAIHKTAEVGYLFRDHGARFTRVDSRCKRRNIIAMKAAALVRDWPALANGPTPAVQLVGAGDDARRMCDALRTHGVEVVRFFDIDQRRIGGSVRGVAVVAHETLVHQADTPTLVAIVRRDARPEIRAEMASLGRVEGTDWLFVA